MCACVHIRSGQYETNLSERSPSEANIPLHSHEIDLRPPPPPAPPSPTMIDHVHNGPNQAPVLSHTNPVHCDFLKKKKKKATVDIFCARVRHSLTHSNTCLRFPLGRLSSNFVNK